VKVEVPKEEGDINTLLSGFDNNIETQNVDSNY
jgi:hypothetical protein